MSKRKSQGGKIPGIYQRGNIFWYTRMVHGKRLQVSLHTVDYGEAVVKAKVACFLSSFLSGNRG